jgi:hypothetical protein
MSDRLRLRLSSMSGSVAANQAALRAMRSATILLGVYLLAQRFRMARGSSRESRNCKAGVFKTRSSLTLQAGARMSSQSLPPTRSVGSDVLNIRVNGQESIPEQRHLPQDTPSLHRMGGAA